MRGKHTLIGITTYMRPEMLRDLLQTLAQEVSADACHILVVDNDASRSGFAPVLAARTAGMSVSYQYECQTGVVHGRNRILRVALEYDAVVFLDDDERVEPGWFNAMQRTHELHPSAVVTGPVYFELPTGVAGWVRDGQFFDRPNWPNGHLIANTGTGNSLVPVSALRLLEQPWFDAEFARTGGEDTEFFERLRRAGVPIVWCREARVVETVPMARTTWRALTGRCIRTGNIRGRLTLRVRSRTHVLAGGLARIVCGGAIWGLRIATGRPIRVSDIGMLFSGIGHVQAAMGKQVEVYGGK